MLAATAEHGTATPLIARLGRAAAFSAASLSIVATVSTLGLAVMAVGPANAATMTFSGLSGDTAGSPPSYVENGITATGIGGSPAFHTRPGALHLDDSGTPFPHRVEFTMALPFHAISVDILPIVPTAYCSDPSCESAGDPYDNVLWEGLVGDTVVASSKFFMGTTNSTYTFGDTFRGLDKLAVTALLPDFDRIGGACFDAPCAHFDLDNLVLAPVPLPAGIWLFASGIGILGAMGGRLRRSSRRKA